MRKKAKTFYVYHVIIHSVILTDSQKAINVAILQLDTYYREETKCVITFLHMTGIQKERSKHAWFMFTKEIKAITERVQPTGILISGFLAAHNSIITLQFPSPDTLGKSILAWGTRCSFVAFHRLYRQLNIVRN